MRPSLTFLGDGLKTKINDEARHLRCTLGVEIHEFDNDFDFCTDCAVQGCRERIQSVLYDTLGGL